MSSIDEIVVGFPLYKDCTLLDFAGATQIFTPFTGAGFKPVWIAADPGPVATTEGVTVLPNYTFENAPKVDILFMPGGGAGVADAMLDCRFIAQIQSLAEHATWVGSVCTGAFIIATAGLLNKHHATTYWSQLENLSLFPEIMVDVNSYPRALIENNRFTGGGISSSIDLALSLVEKIRGAQDPEAGKAMCQTVQLANQYAPHPPYNAGDPDEAPPEITAALREAQAGFIQVIREAVQKVIGS